MERRSHAPVSQCREACSQVFLQREVDFGESKPGPRLRDPCEHMTPRIDDQRIAIRFAAVLVNATLRSTKDITQIFHGARPQQ